MPEFPLEIGATVAIPKAGLDDLLKTLHQMDYRTIGPKIKDDVVVYSEVSKASDLPVGWKSVQEPGCFRLERSGEETFFGFTPGGQSWKQFFFPPRSSLFQLTKNGKEWTVNSKSEQQPNLALIGVRPCELSAIEIQDRVFLQEEWDDTTYRRQRQSAFILAVDCLHPGSTCFCSSMGNGPNVQSGYDIRLTELEDIFLAAIGSDAGKMVLSQIKWQPATSFWTSSAKRKIEDARLMIHRKLEHLESIPSMLLGNLNANHWDDVAKRCMSCTNCTMVCPTCFCWDVSDTNDLSGNSITRERVWDSCFNPEYSYVFGGNNRPNTRSRYRQWLTHKLGSWVEQFGVSGCVGCGRCITWCPAGIDITAEVKKIQEEVMA